MPREVAGGERTAGTFLAARSARRVAIVILGAATAVLLGKMALAYWTSPGNGTGVGSTATMFVPASVTGSSPVNTGAVAVSWQAATLSTGAPVTGYFVTRTPDGGGASSAACGTSATSLTTELRCDDTGVAEGTYRYVVTAVRGSWTAASANSAAVKVIFDYEAPVVTASTSPAPNANGYHRVSPVSVDISATDEAGVASITYSVNNGSPVTVTTSSVSVPVSGDGTHTVTYSAKDVVGHVSTTQSITVRIDTVAPAAPPAPVLVAASDTGVSSSDRITNDTTPTFSGTGEPGHTINLYGDAPPVIGSAVVAADGTYTVTVTKEEMASGTHTVTVRAVDLAGNRSAASPGTSLTIDTTAPSAPSAAPSLTAGSDSGRSSSDRITKVTTPTFTGTGTTGTAWVVLYAGGVQVGSGSASSTSYAVTSGALSHAAHSVTVRVTDVAGNLSTASPATTVTVDTVAPAAPSAPVLAASSDSGASSSDRVTNDNTPTMTGSNESSAQVTLFAGSNQVGTETTTGTSYSVTSSALADGDHVLTATATDVAGNSGPASGGTTVTIDTTAPTPSAPQLVADSDSGESSSDRVTNDTTPTFTGTAPTGTRVQLYAGSTPTGAVVTAVDGTYTATTDTLTSGSHSITARNEPDTAGNVGTSAATTVTVDTTAPSATSAPTLTAASDSGRSSSDGITNNRTPTFTGTGTTSSVRARLYAGGVEMGSATISSSDYTVTSGSLLDAGHSMTVRVSDLAGNLSAASPVTTVTVDTVAPAAPSAPVLAASSDSGASSSDRVTNDNTPTMTGSNESSAQVTLFAGSNQVGTEITTGPSYSVTSSVLADGDHVLTATATDVAGNSGPASGGTTVTIDTTAPTPSAPQLVADSDSGESSSDRVTNDTTPTFTGTAPTGTRVQLYAGSTPTGAVVTAVDGTYTATTDTLTSGSHSITARNQPDTAGNVGTSAATTVTVDTTAPSATSAPTLTAASDSGRSSSDGITNNKTPTFTGTGTTGSVRARLYAGGVEMGSATISSSTYTVTSGSLLDAGHSMTVRVSDLAGNLSAASPVTTVTVDTVAPAAPSAPVLAASSDSGASSSDRVTNDNTPTMTGSNESSAQVTLFAGSNQVGSETTTGTSYSVTSSTLADGDHVLTATATDVAGNLGPASAGTTVTIDTTAPAASAPVLTAESDSGVSSSDAVTNDRTPTFTGTAPVGANVRLFSGGTQVGVGNAVDGTYTITVDTLDSGTPGFSARTDPDQAGNVGVVSATTSVTIDFTGPTVTFDESSSWPIRFRANFSEPVFGFTDTDVVIGGTAAPTSVTVTGSGLVYDAEVSGMQRSGTVTASIPADGTTDRAGNGNAASTSTDNSVDYVDSSAPTVAITSFAAAESQSATVSGNAGITPGDPSSITVVLCTTDAQTCPPSDTKATLTATVNATTGVWSVTSGSLGTVPALYARAAATDLSGNTTQTAAAGPIAIP